MNTLRFVPLSDERIKDVLEIEGQAVGSLWTESGFRRELSSPQSIFLIALVEGKPVGFGGVWLIVDEAHVLNLAVAADWRRKGIARTLLFQLLEKSKERGAVCSTLEVRTSNEAAIKLYESLGYSIASTRKRYYPDNREDAYVMWRHNL